MQLLVPNHQLLCPISLIPEKVGALESPNLSRVDDAIIPKHRLPANPIIIGELHYSFLPWPTTTTRSGVSRPFGIMTKYLELIELRWRKFVYDGAWGKCEQWT